MTICSFALLLKTRLLRFILSNALKILARDALKTTYPYLYKYNAIQIIFLSQKIEELLICVDLWVAEK